MRYRDVTTKPLPSPKDFLLAFTRFPNYLNLIASENNPYQSLLNWLKANCREIYHQLPVVSEIAAQTGVPSSHIPKHLKLIYDAIYQLNLNEPNRFIVKGQIPCFCNFKYIDYHASFNLGLDVIPRRGEVFEFGFIYPQCGGSYFHVHNVSHEIENGKQTILLTLNSDKPQHLLQLPETCQKPFSQEEMIVALAKKYGLVK